MAETVVVVVIVVMTVVVVRTSVLLPVLLPVLGLASTPMELLLLLHFLPLPARY